MKNLRFFTLLVKFAFQINLTLILDTDSFPSDSPLPALSILLYKAISFHAPDSMSWAGWIFIVCIAVCCLFLSAFVSGSEIAFFGLSPEQCDDLEEDERPVAAKARGLLSHSEKLLATILISNNLVNITMVVLLTFAIQCTVEFGSEVMSFVLQTVVLTFLLLLFGEIFPKLVARGRTLQWVVKATPGVNFLFRLFSPLSSLMVRSTAVVNRIVKKDNEEITTEELSQALEISEVDGKKDKEMLEGILTFGDKEVSDIMTPRVDVTDIEYHSKWSEVMEIIIKSGFSRIPVYDSTQDSIRGILYAKDLLPYIALRDDNDFQWQTLIRKPYFVPESKMIDDLMEDFRKRKIHIAIVVDEYGDTQGIVTLEDIIEEIVGDINDEYDDDDKMYRQLADGSFIFDAKIPLTDFFRATDLDDSLANDYEAETLAGLLLDIKGDFPEEKETFRLRGVDFTVLKIEKHRILSVKVKVNNSNKDE